MFLLNSCLDLFSAACSRRRPFSRSYGAILPSSLTMLLPPALGFSPHPPVSVFGTGPYYTIAAFLDGWLTCFATLWFAPLHDFPLRQGAFPPCRVPRLSRAFHSRVRLSFRVPAVLIVRGTGISTCCPSTTALALALGPDLPRADQLYPGNLGYSAARTPTLLSLLIPAFSLPGSPRLLTMPLRPSSNAPLPIAYAIPQLRCHVLAPDIFGAGPLG